MISRRALFGVGFAAFATRAQAQSTRTARLRAPYEYRNLPTGPVRLLRFPTLDDSRNECMRRGVGGGSTACSFYYPGGSVVVYSDPGDLPHELDHIRLSRAGIPNRNHEGWR